MNHVPGEIEALVREREAARSSGDFARADELRDEMFSRGFIVRDTSTGSVVEERPPFDVIDPRVIENTLTSPGTLEVSVHLLYEGSPGDLGRFLRAFAAHHDPGRMEVVLVDPASSDGVELGHIARAYGFVRVIHLDRPLGWAAARNAGLMTSRGEVIVLADLSIEPTGDIITPLVEALAADHRVVVAGPFGLVTKDMKDFTEHPGPDVHAIEGYLLATRRAHLAEGLLNERFSWYRNADLDLSFQLRANGGRALVVPVPLRRHTHRGWASLSEEERASRSRRNHTIFYRRWKGRLDLIG